MKDVMASDIENAKKAAQSAAFLCNDLQQLVGCLNRLVSDLALDELEIAAKLRTRLERLQSNLELVAD